ncbi:uncharacterized protein LOC117102823 isoform X2 [Anneissia japonica]|nr:uncharacterized protein LOC117102823 isoform X2 [Anneissia japonica]
MINENVVIPNELDKLTYDSNEMGGEPRKENNSSNNEYRTIVDDEKYIDLCPQNDTDSKKGKRKSIVNNANIDKSITLHLIEEEVVDVHPVKETPAVDCTESNSIISEESIGNFRSFGVSEIATGIDITLAKTDTNVYRRVYNELENSAENLSRDKGNSYLANELSLIADVNEIQRNEELHIKPSNVKNEILSSRQCIPTVVISEPSDAVDRNHNIEYKATVKRHQPEVSGQEPLRLDLDLNHVFNEEVDLDQFNGTVEAPTIPSATTGNMATPEDIACFYQDEEQTLPGAPLRNNLSSKDAFLGRITETSFVAVIPNSLNLAADNPDMPHGISGTKHENDGFPKYNAEPTKGTNHVDCYGDVTDNTETENVQEYYEEDEDEEENEEEDDEDSDEDSDESGGLETIEEVSEEEFDSSIDDIASIDDTCEIQDNEAAIFDDLTENTQPATFLALDNQYKQTTNGRQSPKVDPDDVEDHFDVCEHDLEECQSVPTVINTSLKTVEGSNLDDRETETLVGVTHLKSNRRIDTQNDFVINKQDNVDSALNHSVVDHEKLLKNVGNYFSDLDLNQSSLRNYSDDHVIAKQEVKDNSHGNNEEVTGVKLKIYDQENQLNCDGLMRMGEEIDLLQRDLEEKPSELENIQNSVITTIDLGDASTQDDRIVGSRSEPVYGAIDDRGELSPTSKLIQLEFDKPLFTEIKELEKIRPLPFLTELEQDTDKTLNKTSFYEQEGIRFDACVEPNSGKEAIQHESLHGQIEQNTPGKLIDTTANKPQLDFEATLSNSLGVKDNSYSDDVCKHDLTSPSQCSEDQASVEQISQQTGKQSITIELHLVRRKPACDREVRGLSDAKEDIICATSSSDTAQSPQENTNRLPKSTKTKDETIPATIKTDVITLDNNDRCLDKTLILRNAVDDRRGPNSNDDISRSHESITSESTSGSRTLSVHEKRILDSLKNLQLPEWYKKSEVHKQKMKNMAEGNVCKTDNGIFQGRNRYYGRPKSSSFGSDDSDCSSTKSRPVITRMSYERKAKYYYSTQHIPTQRDDYQNGMLASTPYLKSQSNYDIRSFDSENRHHVDHSYGKYSEKELQNQPRINERPQSESDLVNMDPIPMNNFKIQRQRSNKGTATFYITSVNVQNTEQKAANYGNSHPELGSDIKCKRSTNRDENNAMDQVVEINNDTLDNGNVSYPEETSYKHSSYSYKSVYGTPLKKEELPNANPDECVKCDTYGTLPEQKEYYTVWDHKDYHASVVPVVQCEDDKVIDLSSSNRSNFSPDITNDSAINLETMSSGPESESSISYDESWHSGSFHVPSVTHSAPSSNEKKHKSKPANSKLSVGKNISLSYDDISKQQQSDNQLSNSNSRIHRADKALSSNISPRFPVINRSRDDLLTNDKKIGISISITDTRLDDPPNHRIDEEEFEKHLYQPDQQPNSKTEDVDKALVMEDIIDGLLGLPAASVNDSSTFSYNESGQSSSNLLSSESESSVTSARRRSNDFAKRKKSTGDDKNHVVHCRKCRISANLDEARKSFKNCHHCYTYYCSRDCRKQHWEEHKQRCVFARVSSSCKRAIAVCRDDGSTHYTLSKIARTCYLSRGRGCILIVFPNEEAARLFVCYGLRAVPSPPSYITARELEKTPEPNEHTKSLLSVCQSYDPNQSFIINVIVNIGTDIPKKPVSRRQGTAIKKCAKFSLCDTHVVQPSVGANETTGETLILTMPPGLPPDGTRDRKLRQVCFVNIQRHLRQREVKLRHQFPSVYSALCRWVEYHESFPPTTIYPTEGSTSRPFMCLIMPESDPDALGWVTNPGLLEDIDIDGEFD